MEGSILVLLNVMFPSLSPAITTIYFVMLRQDTWKLTYCQKLKHLKAIVHVVLCNRSLMSNLGVLWAR